MEHSRPRCDFFARTFVDASASGVAWRMGQTVNARDRIRRSYCCPTAAKSLVFALRVLGFLRDLQEKQRADERTRTAYLLQLRVITHALQGCAGYCKCRIFRGVSFPCLAACCTVLHSRWCQSGVNSIYLLNSRYCASLQVVLQEAGCRLRRGTKHFYRNASASSHI